MPIGHDQWATLYANFWPSMVANIIGGVIFGLWVAWFFGLFKKVSFVVALENETSSPNGEYHIVATNTGNVSFRARELIWQIYIRSSILQSLPHGAMKANVLGNEYVCVNKISDLPFYKYGARSTLLTVNLNNGEVKPDDVIYITETPEGVFPRKARTRKVGYNNIINGGRMVK